MDSLSLHSSLWQAIASWMVWNTLHMLNSILRAEILDFNTSENKTVVTYNHLWQAVDYKQ